MSSLIPVVIHALRHEALGVIGIELRSAVKEPLPAYEPGAHIDLHLGGGLVRSYSLIGQGGDPDFYRICVQVQQNGRGGSKFIGNNLKIGDKLNISAPRNNFALAKSLGPSVLIAGGIGITPIYSMFERLCAAGRQVDLLYCARSKESAAFLDQLAGRPGATFYFGDEGDDRPSLVQYLSKFSSDASFYCCGPARMLESFQAACSELGLKNAYVERFSGTKVQPRQSDFYQVKLVKSNLVLDVPPDMSLLEAVLEAGVQWDYACKEGICGACEASVLQGEPDHRDSVLTDQERAENRRIMICVSGSRSEKLVLDL